MKIAILIVSLFWIMIIVDMGCTVSKQVKTVNVYKVIAVKNKCCDVFIQDGLDIRSIKDSIRWSIKTKGDTVMLWR